MVSTIKFEQCGLILQKVQRNRKLCSLIWVYTISLDLFVRKVVTGGSVGSQGPKVSFADEE